MSAACAAEPTTAPSKRLASPAAVAEGGGEKKGRKANKVRPRIDIDDDIQSANELSTIMKKLAHAAKMEQRNAARCKARLLKKCAKVSAQDLERLSILKRCGLLAEEPPAETPGSAASSSTPPAKACAATEKPKPSVLMLRKLANLVSKSNSGSALSSVAELQSMVKAETEVKQKDTAPTSTRTRKTKTAIAKPPTPRASDDEEAADDDVPVGEGAASDVEEVPEE